MTLYLVKHGSNDYRLHRADGSEISSPMSSRPDARTQVDMLTDEYNGANILDDPTARRLYTDIVTGEVRYRDLTIPDETVPWQSE